MIEIFPHWKELSSETKSELIRFGKALKEKMQNAPTVDAVEVVHGWWELLEKAGMDYWCCSACDSIISEYWAEPKYNYCPNCGAKMDGDGNG